MGINDKITQTVNRIRPTRHLLWLVAFLWWCSHLHAADTQTASGQKLQLLMEQARAAKSAASATATDPNSVSTATVASAPPAQARMQERALLLARGEAALARNDTDAAQTAFESAATILHAADTEMGIVRTYMQQGQYRRALAFGAHTAGAHLDVVGGSALYAWLLHVGGQATIANRLITEAQLRVPQQTLLTAVQQQLQSAAPLATGPLLQAPVRMAPYGTQTRLPAHAQVLGSGLLIDQGQRALVPLTTLSSAKRYWVRNGLGQLVQARVEQKLPKLRLAVLKLATPLPMDAPLTLASNDSFPGSVAYAVEYVPSKDATPRWPVLHTGFLGGLSQPHNARNPDRQLGLALTAGPRGGPVFDSTGYLSGIAISQRGQPDLIVMTSRLHQRLGNLLGRIAEVTAPNIRPRASVDQVYESALRTTLQLISER